MKPTAVMETMTSKPKITKEQAKENLKAFRKELKEKAWSRVANSKIPDLVRMGMLMARLGERQKRQHPASDVDSG